MSSIVRPPGSLPHRSELELLSDAEIVDLAGSVAERVTEDGVDVSAVRALLADWALVARIRRRPDFEVDRAAYQRATGSD